MGRTCSRISGDHCRALRVTANVTTPTIRRATDSGTATIDVFRRRRVAASTPLAVVGARGAHHLAGPELPSIQGGLPGRHARRQRQDLGRHQLWVDESPSSVSGTACPVEIERLDDAALRLLDGGVEVRGRQIDEPHRQFADELLEIDALPREASAIWSSPRGRESRRSMGLRRMQRPAQIETLPKGGSKRALRGRGRLGVDGFRLYVHGPRGPGIIDRCAHG